MAIFAGTKTTNVTNPGGNTITFNHNQNTGADGLLVIAVAHSKSNQVSNIKYNNVTLTTRLYHNGSTNKYGFFVLPNPATGTNQVKITMTGGTWNPVGSHVYSFTGASSDGGVVGNNDVANTPHSRNRAGVTVGSRMLLMGISTQSPSQGSWTIGGQTLTKRHNLSIGNKMGVGLSTQEVSGTVTCVVTASASWKKFTNNTIEIKAAVAATPTLTVSETVLSGFTYEEGSGPSSNQTFTVSGDDLTANAIITAPTNYEVSLSSGSGFGGTASIGRSGGDLVSEPRTVYVRLKTGLSESNYNSETLSVSSTGATTRNITLNGSVTATSVVRRRIIIIT